MAPGIFVFQYPVCEGLVAIQVRDSRTRQNRNLRGWMCATDRLERRNRHHGVAHPIWRAHKNFHRAAPFRLRLTASVIALRNSSAGSSSDIRQQYTGME